MGLDTPTATTFKVVAVGRSRLRNDQAVGVAPSTRWMSGFICCSCWPQ
jgi:hypothetical protein